MIGNVANLQYKIKRPDPAIKGMSRIDAIMVDRGLAYKCEITKSDNGKLMKCGEPCNGLGMRVCYDFESCPDRAQYERAQAEKRAESGS